MTRSDTETLLLQEIAPRLRAAIPQTVPLVGPDDPEELLQDGLATAIQIHRGAAKARKKVTAGNIAHYTLLALRSGRRSTGTRTHDVLHPAAQLNGHARVQSLDEPIGEGEDEQPPEFYSKLRLDRLRAGFDSSSWMSQYGCRPWTRPARPSDSDPLAEPGLALWWQV